MNFHVARVCAALNELEIHGRTEFSWRGERSQRLPRSISAALTAQTARAFLLSNIQETLYSDVYTRGGVRRGRSKPTTIDPPGRTEFVERLSAANAGTGYLLEDWVVRRFEPDAVVLNRGGLDVWALPEECVQSNGSEINRGGNVGLRFPKEHLTFAPGFYLALSNATFSKSQASKIVRLYWNLREAGAEAFIGATTTALNRAGVPFRAKVLRNSGQFGRCDAGVLYLPRSDYLPTRAVVADIYSQVAPGLRRRTPVFTKRLADGLALAEDTGSGQSFGMDRCRLLAEGAVRAHRHSAGSLQDRLAAVADCFVEAGLSLDRPYLASGSKNDYELLHQRNFDV